VSPEKSDPSLPFLREEALDRIGGDEGFLDELLALYDDEYASKKRALAEAIGRKDAAEIQKIGHGLKGSSANLSLPGLREAACAVEKAGAAGDFAAAQGALGRLTDEYAKLKAFLAPSA
jgi:HPt (histidine-containing phosphotransfer) domain-containing protein